MKYDVLVIGAGPAGIFTALELKRKGFAGKIAIAEKGAAIENRACPKVKTQKCVDCKPYCHITTGFSGAGAFSDGKLSLSCEVGGDFPDLVGAAKAQVLPVPVWAQPSTSRPARAGGMAFSWRGEGFS